MLAAPVGEREARVTGSGDTAQDASVCRRMICCDDVVWARALVSVLALERWGSLKMQRPHSCSSLVAASWEWATQALAAESAEGVVLALAAGSPWDLVDGNVLHQSLAAHCPHPTQAWVDHPSLSDDP